MTTLWTRSSSADPDFTATVGAAPSVVSAGSYGERYTWAAQTTVSAYGYKTLSAAADFSIRAIYHNVARPSTSFSVLAGQTTGSVIQWRADITSTGLIRIRNATATVTTGTVALALSTEHRLEVARSGSTLTFSAYRVSDNALIDSITGTVPTTAMTDFLFGNQAGITGTLGPYSLDEIIVRDVAGEIGPVSGSNVAPVANAGANQTGVEPYASVFLDGSATDSDGTVSSLIWTHTGGLPSGLLPGGDADPATFEAPGTLAGTVLTFTLTATDNLGATGTDTMTVTVLPVTERAVIGGVEVPMKVLAV